MLESREITTFSTETLGVFLTKQCRQGGNLLPLLWSLIVNGLVWELNSDGSYMVGNADDITVLSMGNSLRQHHKSYKLSVQPNVTKKRDLKGLKNPPLP
jgi:hypothetical protein